MYKLTFSVLIATTYLLVASGEILIKEKKLPCERLSNNVAPTGYQMEFQFPSFEAPTFQGHVNISLRFPNKKTEANEAAYEQLVKGLLGETCKFGTSSDSIVLHADPSVRLLDVDVVTESCGWVSCLGKSDKKRTVVGVSRDTEKQLIEIKLRRGIHAGNSGRLSMKFESKFGDNKRGVYVSTYNDGSNTFKHVVSQFQPTDARHVFPVFDEPRFKVPFQVSVVHPAGLTALSNTNVETTEPAGDQLTRTTFKQTPPMSVHMVAFTVGQFDEPLEWESTSLNGRRYKVRVFTEPGKRESGHFALEVAQHSLEYFEQYINYQFPLDKFDIVAIADHDKDNTESWGLSFIRDSLVWIDEETRPDSKVTTAINVAHVCVHQWFANLVTAAWWNDLWITEGVAAQFSFKIVRELYPEFESEYFVRLATLSNVMQLDATGRFHALKPKLDELHTSNNIHALFNNVHLMKGAALAQMLANWMDTRRPHWYRDFLRLLVSSLAFKSVNRRDYVMALKSTVGEQFGKEEFELISGMVNLIDSFNSKHGVTLVNVKFKEGRLMVDIELMPSARRNIEGPLERQARPLLVYGDARVRYHNGTTRVHVPNSIGFASDRGWSLAGANFSWIKVSSKPDVDAYYRTRYTDRLYNALCEPIRARQLTPMHRLQLLDDANALVQKILITGDTFKQLIDCYSDEDESAVLLGLMVALKTLDTLKLESPSSKALLRVFEKYEFATSGRESLLEQRARSVALKRLIKQGNQQVIEAALKKFDEGNVAVFLREPVYIAIALEGTCEQVKQLEQRLYVTKSHQEKLRLATALSMSEYKKVLRNLVAWMEQSSGLSESITKPIIDSIKSKLRLPIHRK